MTASLADAIVAEIEARYDRASISANAHELAQIFAEDATVQTEWGPVLDGRPVIERGLVALFGSPKGQGKLRNTPVLSRLADPDVIVSHGVRRRNRTRKPFSIRASMCGAPGNGSFSQITSHVPAAIQSQMASGAKPLRWISQLRATGGSP